MIFRVYKIVALTEKGRLGLKKNDSERKKMGALDKLIFNKLFDVVIDPDFNFIIFQGKTQASVLVDPERMKKQLVDSMLSEGCSLEDFNIFIE